MTTHLRPSTASTKAQLRLRVIATYHRAQRSIAVASTSPSAKTHAMMIAYEKACERLRADIVQAGELFPSTDALVAWLLEELTDDVMPEQDRIGLALAVRTISGEVAERQKAS
jgi:hypothetical protein